MNDMTHANYTHGFSGGLTVRGMPVLNSYGGNVYWVDSGGAANGAGTFQRPFTSIDIAVGNCTANNGDYIMVKPGHAETVSAAAGLDLDVAGITIIFLGNDNDRGTITFGTDVLADMDVDAADITMIGARFVMGLDNVTAPIDVNAARFTMINTIIQDAAAFAPPDWIVADAAADDFTIDGLLYRESTTGTQNQSLIQIAAADRPVIRNVRATGDFATGIIENGTAWIDATLENLLLDNSNASPTVCVLLQAGSTGFLRSSVLRVASGATGYTAANAMQIAPDVYVTGTDGNVAADLTVGNLEDAAATGAVTTTDTLVAYIKQLVTQNGTELDTNTLGAILYGTGGIATFPAAAHPADAVSLAEVLRSVWARNIAGINPLGTVIFVAASGGNDSNAGTSPNAAKATIASAITAAGAGGTIVLGPGTHNVDVSVAALTPLANQQFISAIPSFGGAPRAVIANDADDGANIVVVDVDGTVWRDIEFRNVTAATVCVTQFSISQTTAVRGIHFENCWFNQNAMDGAMISVAMNDATNATTGAVFKHCRFAGGSGTTSVPIYIQIGIGGATRGLIEDCVFELSNADGDTTAIDFLDPGPGGTSSYALTIRHNDFIGPTDGGNDAEAIVVAAAMTRDEIIPAIRNNFFHQCSVAPITVDKFNESIINNYYGDSATGGTLVDPGT